MNDHPKEVKRCADRIAEVLVTEFPVLTPPDSVFVLQLLINEIIAQATEEFSK
jgi:hypothetical protein